MRREVTGEGTRRLLECFFFFLREREVREGSEMLPLLISTSALFLSVASFSSSVAAAYLLLRERSMASGRSVAGKGKRGIEKREGTFVRSSRARHSASAEFLPDEEKAALSLSLSLCFSFSLLLLTF